MWVLDNRTPFAAECTWVRDRDGAEVWLVAMKASFDIAPDGSTTPSTEQPPVLRLPEYHGEPGQSSIKYDADLVWTKRSTDILVVGQAHAPGGRAVCQLDAGFKVGNLQKIVRIFGDRTWGAFGATRPQPFVSMPLRWERAYGGRDVRSGHPGQDWDARNPVGTGFITAADRAQGTPLPNIEDPGAPIRHWRDRPPPAGLGAIASHWLPRAAFAGTYDKTWMETRQPLLAADMDIRWYQSAPADQQTPEFLVGGEPVVLHHLTPDGRLAFSLPRFYPGFLTHFHDGTRQVHTVRRLHTVILEPDLPRVSLVWHSALPCHHKVQKLEKTVVTLKADRSWGKPLHDRSDIALA